MENEVPRSVYELVEATFAEYKKSDATNASGAPPSLSSLPSPPITTDTQMMIDSLLSPSHILTSEISSTEKSYFNCLIKVLKKHHMWPSMQVKKFKDDNNIVLLHSTYESSESDEVSSFKTLYDQCRSIVLDFSMINSNHIVVSYANNIPERIDIAEYAKIVGDNDRYQEAHDGTMVTIFNYNNKWHFGTSSCNDINNSKFGGTKSHGMMFDEVLLNFFPSEFSEEELAEGWSIEISERLRNKFSSYLDPMIAYEFVLIHHENIHIIDYTNLYGDGYKMIYHINSKDRADLSELDINNSPFASLGVKYPTYFSSLEDANLHITDNKNSYGFIVRKIVDGASKLYKISPKHITFREDTDPLKVNVWQSLLAVYMKNSKEYQIKDYIAMYAPNIELPIDNKGKPIDPTYLIHTMISSLKDVLYKLYIATTTYNPKFNRFKMNKDLDSQFPPVIRFHLAQLRHRQITNHKGNIIKSKDVFFYICRCNNIKNIRLLINMLSTSTGYDLKERSSMCLTILDGLL